MGKQKQQVISRFFAPKPNPSSQSPSPSQSPFPNPPKISATVSFSPSKRSKTLEKTLSLTPPPSKKPKTLPPPPPPPSSLNQRFLQKLLEPSPSSSSPCATTATATANAKYTPLEQQVLDLKSRYPDVLLMVEVGYRYRFFGPDAETAAKVLGIQAHVDHSFLTASIPTFRLQFHIRRLVTAGYKVGVVKQTETATIKSHGSNRAGPFARGLSALYTRATLEAAAEEVGGGGDGGNYLVCVVEKGALVENRDCGVECNFDVKVGLIGVEISTGEFMYGEFNDGVTRAVLESVVLSLAPAEILLGEPVSAQTEKLLLAYAGPSSNVRVERASGDSFKDGGALAEVMSLYENISEDVMKLEPHSQNAETSKEEKHLLGIEGIMAMPELAVRALALTIRYLKQFGFERILCLGASFRPFSSKAEMTLSANALQQLEVLKNNSDGSENGSLLQSMNHTLTAFGSRLLRHWVTHPLCDRNSISARLDAVSEIAESMGPCRVSQDVVILDEEGSCSPITQSEVDYLLSSVLTTLGRSPDIQRGITRIFHRTATPVEFISVIHAILSAGKQLQQLHIEDQDNDWIVPGKTVQSSLLRRLILTASSSTITSHGVKLLSALNKEAATQGDLQNLFIASNGQFPEVARGQIAVQIASEKLDLLIGLYRKQLGMHNLEFMSVSGSTHLIELASDVRVPSNWAKVNSTKKTIRYHPPEVITALDGLSLAKEELLVACRATWDNFLLGFGRYYAEFQAAVQALAALDCLHSLAVLSRNQNYVRPVLLDDDEPGQIQICSGRHPVLESILQENFVPNDTNLHLDGEYCQIITGPNMGGKSCYIRQVALIAIMAQVGSFVPASSAKFHVLDGIYTRIGASDSIQRGMSTFFEELSEASHILHNCTSRSLVIIDELGRGTSTHDGVAIAYATLHHLINQKKCMVLFVTHYPKIMAIKDDFPGSVGAYHVSYLTPQKNPKLSISKSDPGVDNLDRGDVTFLYKVVPGMADKSFGLNVARLAQLPPSCIARASVMAAKLEAEVSTRVGVRLAQKVFPETLVCTEENLEEVNLPNQPEFSDGEQLRSSSVDGEGASEELVRAYHALFSCLQSALDGTNPTNSLLSLKESLKLAVRMVDDNRCL
ncbi:DNA mismatch repair protein MSH3 isoform X2 [Magnolia sinica]|uniref:DNA mismatch repair protein MSH3 isoform X2 n=1 Tax=Magnolia sinica TaxID=86752 RepID=UPI002658FAAE|nr:DNA mismatch repair protein MSH3 isoform X2 [Magnolia sinica]